MRTKTLVLTLGAALALGAVARADDEEKDEKPEDTGALMQTLPKAKVTLADGIRQAAKARMGAR